MQNYQREIALKAAIVLKRLLNTFFSLYSRCVHCFFYTIVKPRLYIGIPTPGIPDAYKLKIAFKADSFKREL